MNIRTIPVTDLRRNFGAITAELPFIDSYILTKGGEPFAVLRALPEIKKKSIMKLAGAWKGTDLDNDSLWEKILEKKSRRNSIKL